MYTPLIKHLEEINMTKQLVLTNEEERYAETKVVSTIEIDNDTDAAYDVSQVNTRTHNDKENKIMRCAVYVRVSTNKDIQKESLINQKEMAIQYIKNMGWSLYEVYTDIASGTREKRPQLQKMLKDAEDGKFDIMLTKELSRFARNGALSYQIRDMSMTHGIHMVTMDGTINTLEKRSELFGVMTFVYEGESSNMGSRVRAAFDIKARRGEFLGSNPPLGYKVVNKQLFIRNDETPGIIRRIFHEYMEGKGHDAIARNLYEEDIPTPAMYANKKNAGMVWHGSTIRKILTNPHYMGDLVQNRSTTVSMSSDKRRFMSNDELIIVENTHEPIISRNDFQIVKRLLEERKAIRPQSNKRLFSNMLFCADCGRGMHYKQNSKGYVCGNFNKHGSKRCSNHRVRDADLIEVIQGDFREMASGLQVDSLTKQLEKQLLLDDDKRRKKLPSLEGELNKIKVLKRNALELLSDQIMSKKDYSEAIEYYDEKYRTIEREIASVNQHTQHEFDVQVLEQLKLVLLKKLHFDVLDSELIHRFVEKIEIKADGSPRIHYRFSDATAFYLLNSSNAQHSMCVECGNMSTGWTSWVL